MAKISKVQTRAHDAAMQLVHSDRPLTRDEREQVISDYNPMASHNVGKGAIFFTPMGLAWDLAVMCQPKGAVIDLFAGIGRLAWSIWRHDTNGGAGDINRLVCVEREEEFVQVGQRVLPEAEWYRQDAFDLSFLAGLGEFDCAVSNPPYGFTATDADTSWMKLAKGEAHWKAVELVLRLTYNGGLMVLPESAADFNPHRRTQRIHPPRNFYLGDHFPGITMNPESIDTRLYKDDWQGTKPDVLVVDVNPDDVTLWKRPYGFERELAQLRQAEKNQSIRQASLI